MESKFEKYQKLSHALALKQLEERFRFEIKVNKELFNKSNISLAELKNDSHNGEVFTEEEYEEIYQKVNRSKKRVNNK